ncbi:MAG: hypothetical protein DMF84_05470 [Acidobacteria bacterium]|nr:MAG: hypothetical protein DMF84_05470 [Acidobacteriota bacterium]
MNWKLVLQLSLFGLAMGVATVFVIPSNIEPMFWLVIFIICGYIIARRAPGRYFLHGLMVSIVNSVWITSAHVLLFDSYVANHPREAEMMTRMPLAPKVMMVVTGPVVGVVSGLVLGLFAVLARTIVRRNERGRAAI